MATKAKLQELLAKAGNTLTLQIFAEKVLKPIGVGDSKCKKGVLKGDILANFIDVIAAIYAAGGETVNNGEDDTIKLLAKMKVLGAKYKSGGKLGSTLKEDIGKAISETEGFKRKAVKSAEDLGSIVGVEFTFLNPSTEEGEDIEDEVETVDFTDYSVISAKLGSVKIFSTKAIAKIKENLPDFRKIYGDTDADAVQDALDLSDNYFTKLDALIDAVDSEDTTDILAKIADLNSYLLITNLGTFKAGVAAASGKSSEVISNLTEVLSTVKTNIESTTK